jgi:hypothetical protein
MQSVVMLPVVIIIFMQSVIMLNVVIFYCYAECRYVECRYAECRGAKFSHCHSRFLQHNLTKRNTS